RARGRAVLAAGRTADRPRRRPARCQPVRRRAPPLRDRPRPGREAAADAAGRALRRRRPYLGRRDPAHRHPPQEPRHRRAHHRPQRARDLGNLRPCVYPRRGKRTGAGGAGRTAGQPGRAPGLSRGHIPPLTPGPAAHGFLSGRDMKARLQTSLGQSLVMTPQLRQAIRLLQMSTVELQAEVAEAIETNPLLEWTDEAEFQAPASSGSDTAAAETSEAAPPDDGGGEDWAPEEVAWQSSGGQGYDEDGEGAAERMAEVETLADHLLWQLHLSPLSARDRRIGAMLIDALDEDGYLREPLSSIAESLLPETRASEEEI